MANSGIEIDISWHTDINELGLAEWNRLAESLSTPLLDYEWLLQMERSKSISPDHGWLPCHLALRRSGDLIAVAPLYIKGHSQGEFVYDYMWADVAGQLGVKYYPKLVGMSPATPAVGYRFLIDRDEDEEALTDFMLRAIDAFCEANELSGANFNFVDPDWGSLLASRGYAGWFHQSYEWRNTGFDNFEDYLAAFNKNQRRNIRRERRSMVESGVTIRAYTGDEIPDSFYGLMWNYYESTNDQFGPWAAKFLNKSFFTKGLEGFRHRLLFIAATVGEVSDNPVALSMLLTKGDVLIGRYWGTDRMIDNLHFDACYYAPIEWAIERGIGIFDPGAGSPHKLRRGFVAVGNYSYHKYRDPQMRGVMDEHIDRINRMEEDRIGQMNESVPLKELPEIPSLLAGKPIPQSASNIDNNPTTAK